jgi:hypothetical protein
LRASLDYRQRSEAFATLRLLIRLIATKPTGLLRITGRHGSFARPTGGDHALTLCDERHMPKPSKMHQIKARESSEVAMKNDPADRDLIDQALMTYDLSDEALEAAARVDGGRAITVGHCATVSNVWYCMPF